MSGHKCKLWAMLASHFLCCRAGVSTLLLPHSGVSGQRGVAPPAALRPEHLRPRRQQRHQLRFLRRRGPTVRKQQHHLVPVEIPHVVRYVLVVLRQGRHCHCGKHFNRPCQRRGPSLSSRPGLRGAGPAVYSQLLSSEPQAAQPRSDQLLCLPERCWL